MGTKKNGEIEDRIVFDPPFVGTKKLTFRNESNGIECYNGHKVPDHIENPLTVELILKNQNGLTDRVHEIGMSPNVVTGYGLVFGLLAMYFIGTGRPKVGALFLLLFFAGDCIDGTCARKYDQATSIGDIFDHTRDSVVMVGVLLVTIYSYPLSKGWIVTLIVILVITLIQAGFCESYQSNCMKQDCNYNFLRICQPISSFFEPSSAKEKTKEEEERYKENLESAINVTKYFSDFTFILVLALYLFTRD
jgi:CDP-alcohol phosphatidyltransferase